MASHQIAIAKASFAAGLLRPDPASVSRDEIARFHALLDAATTHCSPPNVQRCKNWLLDNVIPSAGRIVAFAKYLVALSDSFVARVDNPPETSTGKSPSPRTSKKRRRLHVLFLLNDILHHTKYHTIQSSRHNSLASNVQPYLVNLFTLAASFDSVKNGKHHRKLHELLDVWERSGFQGTQFIESLRQAVKIAGSTESLEISATLDGENGAGRTDNTRPPKDIPFVMPASHGDPYTPYYDLPAGNLMPHIVPNMTVPIDPQQVKPLQFVAGPAEESLANVVRDFLKDVEAIYHPRSAVDDQSPTVDIDDMGQHMVREEATGELVAVEGYYGWSIGFCERMKKRKRGGAESISNGRVRGRSRSTSSSAASSAPRKRRRNDSSVTSRERSRNRHHSRSRSSSRPRNFNRDNRDSPYQSRSRSLSPAKAIEPSRPTPATLHIPSSHSSFNQPFVTPADQIDNPFSLPMPPAPVAPNSYQHHFPIGPGGLPIPPPPPFHQGPWPPPPPALPAGVSFNPGQYPNYSTATFPAGNFVPPHPPGWHNQQQSQEPGFGQFDPPQPPLPHPLPPSLGPGWHEGPSRGRGGHDQWAGRNGNGRGGGKWNRGQDARWR